MAHCNYGRSLLLYISSLLFLFMIGSVHSHTHLSSLIIDGRALPESDGIRPHPTKHKEYPLAEVNKRPNGLYSNDMTCGWLPEAARPANRKITVEAGTDIGLQWWHNNPGDDVLARSHYGPCLVWMAKSETGAGNVWFKIWQKGYDSSRGKWCTDDVINARGVLNGITIPADISPGNYLLRGEILALHEAGTLGGVQPYVHCAELTITGSGTSNPSGVAIPGVYNPAEMLFDLYVSYNSYTIPGPPVYVPGRTPTPGSTATSSTSSSTGEPETDTTTGSSSTGAQDSDTTGSSSSGDPITGTSTGSAPNTRCPVSISQSSISSWVEGGRATSQYSVVITNTGSSDLDLKFRLSGSPLHVWNLVENSDGTYLPPAWLNGKLRPGQAFSWGYIVRRRRPLRINLVVPSC